MSVMSCSDRPFLIRHTIRMVAIKKAHKHNHYMYNNIMSKIKNKQPIYTIAIHCWEYRTISTVQYFRDDSAFNIFALFWDHTALWYTFFKFILKNFLIQVWNRSLVEPDLKKNIFYEFFSKKKDRIK